MTDKQYGFRKHHSTKYTAIELIDQLTRAADKKNKLLVFT